MIKMKSPSNEQIKLADKIADILELDFPRGDFDFTRYAYWKFINENIEQYNQVRSEMLIYANNNSEDDIWFGFDLGLWEF